MSYNYQRIILKIGSNVLTKKDGLPDLDRIAHIVEQIAVLKKQDTEVVLVSSGAVASGRSLISISDKSDSIATRQLFASIGQVKLINTYSHEFEKYNMLCSQVLVTKEDFRDRLHYLNMKSCLKILLQHHVVPVVNENDVVSVTELMFTDNDELAGLIASMLNAQALIVLTNVDGIYDNHPTAEGAKVIEKVSGKHIDFSAIVSTSRSQFGRGGMITKSTMAQKIAQLGIAVHIANGTRENILPDLMAGKVAHTFFVPTKSASGKKKWIAHSGAYAKGVVQINAGARLALTSAKASSLLPVGIINILSDFKKGEIIKLVDENNKPIGLGIAEYGSEKAAEMMGQKNQKALIHYDYLYLEC
ncbi:glutamate 5-kinase [Mucilaginibacter sp. L3T2-6]|uniref:glutamate 5-kinase n=1 Tax=Mucilaginibacter sp. L3T2-6 TaxID=3062491 RepID=UPI002676F33F|nr:glutamate 5-kinase [Mucilaginibacter sp. L3T2-6]MDO3643091.1 glutamate 5-kinase [Mucilaginibacter sp. L3T2-6]MDV6215858.1 glutamate 5-kinase [Mucilaginibacter sp. L3T2-6]